MDKVNVSVIGANGYVGLELCKILKNHPNVNIVHCVSRCYANQSFSDVFPGMSGMDMDFSEMNLDLICQGSEYVFLALPHGFSMEVAKKCVSLNTKVIDLSGDFRYDDIKTYEKWYNITHTASELNEMAVYGLTELYFEKIAKADLIANPGCYTTCSIMALYPLLKDKLIDTKNIIIDAKSGISGAGRKEDLKYSFCEADSSCCAYSIGNHRHTSEIEEKLSFAANTQILLSFTPQLLPVKRGIFATIYANLPSSVTRGDIMESYKNMYARKPFVNIYESGLPELKHVINTNNIGIGFEIDTRLNRLVIVSTIDNLQKGAAGQAVQNLNVMLGIDETTALNRYSTGV